MKFLQAAAAFAFVFAPLTASARELSRAPATHVGGKGFQVSYRRGDAGTARRLHHGRSAVRATGADPARHHRLGEQHADARVRGPVVRPWTAARRHEVLHHHSGLARQRPLVEALQRAEDQIPPLQLRRHGRRAIPAGDGGLGHPPPAAGDGQFDGRHAHLDLGHALSRRHGRAGADGRRSPPRCPAATG